MNKVVIPARIVGGKLEFTRLNRQKFAESIACMPNGYAMVQVERMYRKRSLLQNNYYWGVMLPMVHEGLKDLGWELSLLQCHEWLMEKFSRETIQNEKTGEMVDITVRSSEQSTVQMMAYFEAVSRFAAQELGVIVPQPNEQLKIFAEEKDYDDR